MIKYDINGDNNYSGDILETLLEKRGIEDVKRFLKVDETSLESLENYENMQEGYELLMKHLKAENNIHIIIDPDVDGLTSSATTVQCLRDICVSLGLEGNVTWHSNKGKKHGILLDDKDLKLDKIDLLIVPDAGASCREAVIECYKNDVEVLILDHHELQDVNVLDTEAILINPHSSPKIKNKNISGVGVVYKFFKFVELQLGMRFVDKYLDLVALGNIADQMPLQELETRHLVNQGLDNINNEFIKELAEKQSFSMNGRINITTISWYISPLLNATIRVGKPKEIKDMFEALIGVQREVKYKRKGEIEYHSLQKTMARVCGNVKARQDRQVKKSVELIQEEIKAKELDKSKIIMLDVSNTLDKNYTGLVANRLADYYKRPILLLQERSDKTSEYGGSARNYSKFEVEKLKDYLLETKFFNMCAGHQGAFGINIDKDKVEDCLKFINEDLKHIEISDNYQVDFEIPFHKLTKSMIKQIGSNRDLWGNGVDEPLFAITDVRANSRDIELRGTRAKTLAFERKDIGLYKRFVNEKYHDSFTLKPKQGMNINRDLNYTVIGKLKYEGYKGKNYPKIEIVDYAVKKESKIVF